MGEDYRYWYEAFEDIFNIHLGVGEKALFQNMIRKNNLKGINMSIVYYMHDQFLPMFESESKLVREAFKKQEEHHKECYDKWKRAYENRKK
ncbi:hypothetical protein GOV14_06195 [Candidatus Pacearchaeota archaeon]|nr:hypothetical protein [Candidatus Pacearchaeota archaeon]